MCEACWADEYGRPTELPPNAEEATDLIRELYAHPEGVTGGPLHVQIDDFNIDGVWRPYNEFRNPENRYSDEIVALAQKICDQMNPLSVPHRAAVLALWEGWI